MLRILIVDDEKNARDAIRAIVQSHLPLAVVEEAEGVATALSKINEGPPDIILLDIQLSDGSGFDLLNKIHPFSSRIIFITAFEEHAVRAFRFSAVDYLMKPLNPSDLRSALDKARTEAEKSGMESRMNVLLNNIGQVAKEQKKIVLKTAEQIFIVHVKDILRLEADKNYTQFYFVGGKKIVVSKTLKEYEDLLRDYEFARVHQSHLINLDFVDRYEKKDGGYVVMKDNSTVPVSTRKKEELISLLEKL